MTSVIVDLKSDVASGDRGRRRGLPGRLLRRDEANDRRGPAAPAGRGRAARGAPGRTGHRLDGAGGADRRVGRDGRPRSPPRRGQVRPRHRPPRPRRQAVSACRSTSCSACRRTSPRPTSRSASTSRRSSPSGPPGRPGSRRSRSSSAARPTSRRSKPSAAVYAGPIRVDANTGWTLDRRTRLLPDLVRLGVELIEQPFPARRLDRPGRAPGRLAAADRRRRERGDDRRPRRARRGRRRRQRQARQVRRRRARPPGCWPARASSASGRSSAAWRRRRVGIAASAAVASLADWVDLDGNLLLADDPFDGLELDADCRWRLSDRPGSRASNGGPERRDRTPVPSNARSCG